MILSAIIQGFNHYLIYEDGDVVNTATNTILKINTSTKYPSVNLYENGKKKYAQLHRLLAQAFIPNPDNKPCVNHKDGNKLNYSLDNLEWCTYSENFRHAIDNGLWKITDKHRASASKQGLSNGAHFGKNAIG